MAKLETAVGMFDSHTEAETAVKKLASSGFDITNLSVVGKGYHAEENVVGFYNVGDRVVFWGSRGAFWGGLWGLFFGGVFLTLPFTGSIIVLGSLAGIVISALESALVVGGLSSLGAALYSIGIPKDSVIEYETAIKADGFMVLAHGSGDQIARAKTILGTSNATKIDIHDATPAGLSAAPSVAAE